MTYQPHFICDECQIGNCLYCRKTIEVLESIPFQKDHKVIEKCSCEHLN